MVMSYNQTLKTQMSKSGNPEKFQWKKVKYLIEKNENLEVPRDFSSFDLSYKSLTVYKSNL